MAGDVRLPWIAQRLLLWLVPVEVRDEIIGDLIERHARIANTQGRWAAGRWLYRQILTLRPHALRRGAGRVGWNRRPAWDAPGGSVRYSDIQQALVRAFRAMRFRPVASLTIVVIIALATGLTTSVFTIVNGVLLRPLPFPEPDRLVQIWQTRFSWMDSPNSQLREYSRQVPLSVPTLTDWQAEDVGLIALGGYSDHSFVTRTESGATVIDGQTATSGLFAVLGIEALLGRTLVTGDDPPGAPRVAVLGHGLWMERYGGDAGVLGRSIVLDGVVHAIVGVMPPGFRSVGTGASLWTPLTEQEKADARNSQFLWVVGRLSQDATLASVSSRLEAVQARLAAEWPDAQGDVGSRVDSLLDAVVGDIRSSVWLLFGAVGLVLVIASLNIANLLSVVSLGRRREFAVQSALGAGAGRLALGLLLESAALAVVGGLAGLALSRLSLPLLLGLVPPTIPRHESISMDGTVLLFGLALTALTALGIGALPALRAIGTNAADTLRSNARGITSDRSGDRLRSAFVTGEIALAFILLVGAGLLGASFERLWSVDRGFMTEGLVALNVYPDPLEYRERADRDRFLAGLRDRLSAIPGVAVSATNSVPLTGSLSSTRYEIERSGGEPEETPVMIGVVLENYFDVMGIPLLRGRPFGAEDDRGAPRVGIVNAALAARAWPGASPVGKRLRETGDTTWVTVVGVAGNVRHQGLAVEAEPKLYVPSGQSGRYPAHWVLRVRGDISAVLALAREAVAAESPSTPIRYEQILEERIAQSVAVPRFRMLFTLGLASLAGALALLGVFGVVALSVRQRARDIGVRLALGARSDDVVRNVIALGLRLTGSGILVGLVFTIPAASAARGFLYQIEPLAPWVYVATAAMLLLTTALASWLPARWAARLDPVRILKAD